MKKTESNNDALNELLDDAFNDFQTPALGDDNVSKESTPKTCSDNSNKSTEVKKQSSTQPQPQSQGLEETVKLISQPELGPCSKDDPLYQIFQELGADSSQQNLFNGSSDEMTSAFQKLWSNFNSNKSSTSTGGEDEGFNFSDPSIDKLVNELLSKEMLFEPLKELDQKYPKWLQENCPNNNKNNKPSISENTYNNYKGQATTLHQLISLWEENSSSQNDSEEKINLKAWDLLQKIQDYGPPPEDLLPKESFNMSSEISNFFGGSKDAPQCSLI